MPTLSDTQDRKGLERNLALGLLSAYWWLVCSDAFVLFSFPQMGRNLGKTPSLSQTWWERVAAQPGLLGAQSVSSSDPAAHLQGCHMAGGPWELSDPFPFPSVHQPSSGLLGYP